MLYDIYCIIICSLVYTVLCMLFNLFFIIKVVQYIMLMYACVCVLYNVCRIMYIYVTCIVYRTIKNKLNYKYQKFSQPNVIRNFHTFLRLSFSTHRQYFIENGHIKANYGHFQIRHSGRSTSEVAHSSRKTFSAV